MKMTVDLGRACENADILRAFTRRWKSGNARWRSEVRGTDVAWADSGVVNMQHEVSAYIQRWSWLRWKWVDGDTMRDMMIGPLKALGATRSLEIRYYDSADYDAAMKWINESVTALHTRGGTACES